MKKSYLFILICIAIAMSVIVSSIGNLSTYETFGTASLEQGKKFVVVANLDTTKPLIYDPIKDANRFTFHAIDKKNESHEVIFLGAKPTDFERAEQLVMTGYMDGDIFKCEKVQMKCPSKYESDQIAVATN